jgi:hypothetical protein
MLQIINTMKSGTMKGLIVAFVAWAISLSGLAEQFPDAEKYVDGFLEALTGLSLLYAGYSRKFKPSPPLSQTAADQTASMVKSGELKTTTKVST